MSDALGRLTTALADRYRLERELAQGVVTPRHTHDGPTRTAVAAPAVGAIAKP